MSYKFENTVGGKLVKAYEQAVKECLVVPNHMLPEDYHDNVRGGRTLARLDEMCDKRDGVTEHKKLKALKAENIERYRKQWEENESIAYDGHIDDLQLTKNLMAFCDACPDIEIDEDDLLEQ